MKRLGGIADGPALDLGLGAMCLTKLLKHVLLFVGEIELAHHPPVHETARSTATTFRSSEAGTSTSWSPPSQFFGLLLCGNCGQRQVGASQ